jgi:TonB-linked SusC/RagA family outer membrane protein
MKQILCFSIALLLMNNIMAQQILRISGTVKSASEQKALSGVSLRVQGTNFSTVSGIEGNFSMNVPKNKTLVISHVGFTTKEINTDSLGMEPLVIFLAEKAITMNNVIVSTGYEEFNKGKTTGSYEKIDNELFNRSTGTSLLSRLDGIAGSVLFDHRQGSDAGIQIRGISSITTGSTAPLIILDNFPYEDDINNINPNDVESITILKDAAASSIWGARAGNGVIVITTKKGRFNQPLKLSLSTDIIITPKPNLFTQKNMSTSDFIDVEQFLFNKGYYNSSINNTRNFPPLSPVIEILAKEKAGTLSAADATSRINELRTLDVRNDFEKYLYREGVTQQYGFNLSGGSQSFKYMVSGGYDRNRATLLGSSDDRFTIRSNNTFVPFKNWQLDVSLAYTKSNITNNSPGGYNNITIARTGDALYPYTRLADESGNPLSIDYFYRGTFTDTAGAGRLLDWKYSPLNELNNVSRKTISDALTVDIGLRYAFSKAIKAEVKYQYQNTQSNSPTIYGLNSFEARNLINEFTQINGPNIKYIVPYGDILDAGQADLNGYAFRGQLNFNETINTKHVVNAIAGGEIRQAATSSSSYRTYGYDGLMNFTAVDYVNPYPTFDNIAGLAFVPGNNGFSSTLDRYVSMYANANYTYNKLYTLTGSFRKDASNLFGVNANQKGIPLWSGGTSWNLSDENFYHLKWLPFLKLRATYGFGGNVTHQFSALTTLRYSPGAYQPITNVPYASISNYPNPNLQWEKVGMMNIGFDFGSRNNRITGSIEYFQKNATGLLGSELLDPTLGAHFLYTNSANMKGHGLDIVINSSNIVSKNFHWETNFLFSAVKNKVVKYLNNVNTIGYTSDGQYINPMPGYEPYLIVSYKWGGLDSLGNPLGYVNGKKSSDYAAIRKTDIKDQAIDGPAIPQYFGSLRNTFGWKRLSLSVNMTYRLGYYFRKPSLNYTSLFQYGKGNVEFNNRWQKPGDENRTNVPALLYPANNNRETFYQYADINVEKADHIRLNDIRLSYELPGRIARKLSIQNFEFFALLSNLNLLIWKANKVGLDPEFPTGLKSPMNASFGIKTNF